MKKILRWGVVPISLLFMSSVVSAEVHHISASGQYTMSNAETIDVAQDRAFDYAMRSAAEQAEVYVKSYTKTINSKISEDVVEVVSLQLLKVKEKVITKSIDSNGDIHILAKVSTELNTADINKILEMLLNNEELKNKYIEIEKKLNELEIENKKLKEGKHHDINDINERLKTNEKEYKEINHLSNGYIYYRNNDYVSAINSFSSYLKSKPKDTDKFIYMFRGKSYFELARKQDDPQLRKRCFQLAIYDLEKELEINGDCGFAYSLGYDKEKKQHVMPISSILGISYSNMDKPKEAIRFYTKTLEKNGDKYTSSKDWALILRGQEYEKIGLDDKALIDYTSTEKYYKSEGYTYAGLLLVRLSENGLHLDKVISAIGFFERALTEPIEFQANKKYIYISLANAYLSRNFISTEDDIKKSLEASKQALGIKITPTEYCSFYNKKDPMDQCH